MFNEVSRGAAQADFGKMARRIGLGVLLLVALGTGICSYQPVESGHVGVVYQFGRIIGELQPGGHLIPPWQSVRDVNLQVQHTKFHAKATGDEVVYGTITAASKETQDVFFDVTLNWAVTGAGVQSLMTDVGINFFAVLVPSRVNQYFKAETVKYEATEATQKRELIREDVTKALESDLAKFGIHVVSLQIDNIGYNTGFHDAIESKQKAVQQAAAEQNQVAVRQAQAQQAQAEAKGKADSVIEAARGEAESIRIRAQAQADANTKISASLTDQLIQSQAIENLKNIKGFILPAGNGSSFLFDPIAALR